jgi:hypothetical protein
MKSLPKEQAMPDRKLTREEIALSILNGIIGAKQTKGDEGAFGGRDLGQAEQQGACRMAFQMADLFIKERDEA